VVLAHQPANPAFERGATTRPSVAGARRVPILISLPGILPSVSASMISATSSLSGPQTAATSPNAKWVVRGCSIAAPRASTAAAICVAVPRYFSDTIFGWPSTHAISRRYQ
jgi:hypothetical protein